MAKIFKISNLKKTINYLKKNGIRQAYYAVRERIETEEADDYHFENPSPEELLEQKREGADYEIRFSILVPAYETKEEYLRAMLQSVFEQTYGNFELLLADASESDRVEQVVRSYQDSRIKYRRLKQNAGISANTNQALMYATGDYAALLDHDDLLAPNALFEMAKKIRTAEEQNIQLQMLYSDEDKCDGSGCEFFDGNRKPEFNLDLILSNNYICHFLVMKRQLMQELCFRTVCDGAQDYDLVLRAVSSMLGKDKQRTTQKKLPIAHIPMVLYHWRCHDQSTAENPSSKQYAYDAGKRAVEDFVRSRNWKGKVSHIRHLGFYRVDYQPDLFANRHDTAVVGGKIVNKSNQIIAGACTKEGKVLYEGLHREYSGYMHRASLMQEVEAVDIRCMKASPAAEEILGQMLGLGYMRNPENGRFDWKNCLNDQVDYQELSLRFCEKIRQKGWRIVWDPDMVEKIN